MHKEQRNETGRKRYAEKKDEINAYRRNRGYEKSKCDICGLEMLKKCINRHKKRKH